MSRRRRVELPAIASLDAESARARQHCEEQLQHACDRLLRCKAAKSSVHDRCLETLRPFYETALVQDRIEASLWAADGLQTFLSTYFYVYREEDAFAKFCTALEAAGARWEVGPRGRAVRIESFEVLQDALRRDTATRMVECDAFPLEQPVQSPRPSRQGRGGEGEDELQLPRLTVHGKRPRPGRSPASTPAVHQKSSNSPSRASISAIGVSQSEESSVWFDEDDDEYTLPANSTVIPVEFTTEVVKKSQNWFGRWRTRLLLLKWNELEMRKKNSSVSSRQSAARSFPSQPTMSTQASAAGLANSQTSSSSGKTKRYALQDLISINLVQLNETDPNRKHALDVHFRQAAATGSGYTTKSIILGSDGGAETLKKIMSLISTLALFRGLVAGEKPQQLQRFVQSGANVNAFCSVPSHRFAAPMTPLQLALMQCRSKSDKAQQVEIMKMLREARADPRVFLHWSFARRLLFQSRDQQELSLIDLLLPAAESEPPMAPLTAFGSDEHGWSLLMYLSFLGDLDRVKVLLKRIQDHTRDKLLRYVEHVNGQGDTALHIAIKSSGYRHQKSHAYEDIALHIASCCELDRATSASSLFFISDANGESVMHLAIKARMWHLVRYFLEHKLFDTCTQDTHGNNPLHLLIKIGAPLHIVESMVGHFKGQPPAVLDAHDQTLDASPLLLAILLRRDDYASVLVEARAERLDGDLHSQKQISIHSHDQNDDTFLLDAAIRRRLPGAAHNILCRIQRRGGSATASAMSLAIRHGLYRLALEIVYMESQNHSFKDDCKLWYDPETGSPIPILATMAGQLELAAKILDAGGEDLFNLQDPDSERTLLHSLAFFATEHMPSLFNNPDPAGRRSHSKSMSDGHLLAFKRPIADQQVPRKNFETCSPLTSRLVEELFCQSLAAVTGSGQLTAVCRHRTKLSVLEDRVLQSDHPMRREYTSSILSLLSSSSYASSFQLLALFLAAVRVNPDTRDDFSSALINLIRASNDMPAYAAVSQGCFDKALLLLHCMLPTGSEADVLITSDEVWMDAAGPNLLHLACQSPNDSKALVIIDLFLRLGPCPELWDEAGWSPLHIAIKHGCGARVIQLFTKFECDLNVWSDAVYSMEMDECTVKICLTPLMAAIAHNSLEAFCELIRCGAEPRLATPTYRVGLFHFAARCTTASEKLLQEVLNLETLQRATSKDTDGMSVLQACDILRSRIHQREDRVLERFHSGTSPKTTDVAVESEPRDDEANQDNGLLRITLLGLLTPDLQPQISSQQLSPSNAVISLSPDTSPSRSPSRSSSHNDSSRSRGKISRPRSQCRDQSSERGHNPSFPRHPVLDDSALHFLRGEEKATLTLIAQEARIEAQEWLKKRSGQKKLLSEARAHLQTIQSHRRTGSGTVVKNVEAAPPVTDAQLLDAYKAIAEKQFIDKHVANAVADARFTIEREKRTIYQETGVFPGEIVMPNKAKDNSIGSNSAASTVEGSGIHRSASNNASMMLLLSRSNDLSDAGNDSDRGGSGWWSDQGESGFDEGGVLLGERNAANGTWLSGDDGTDPGRRDGDEAVINPLDREGFAHVIEKRKSMY